MNTLVTVQCMRIVRPLNTRRILALALLSGALAACSTDRITDSGPRVSVCHFAGSTGALGAIFLSDLADHKSHGDYVTSLEVNKTGPSGDSIHFTRIGDALAVARAGRIARNELDNSACRITISVAPGTFAGSVAASTDPSLERFPLMIDVPDITLKGAFKMQVDASSRATGAGEGNDATTIVPSPALAGGASAAEVIFMVNAGSAGPRGDRAIIEGFVVQSGRIAPDTLVGGLGILTLRVRDLTIRGNRFESGFASAVDLRASSGVVERIHFSGRGSSCDVCLAGPGDYVARDNRLIGGGTPGFLIFPTVFLAVPAGVEPYTLPATSTVTALVTNNEVREHLRKPVGVGLRVGAVGVGASSVVGTSKVTFSGNNLVQNTFGIMVEGGFLDLIDPTKRRGNIEVTTSGNTISGSCQNDVLVTLSQSQTGLGLNTRGPLVNSTYNLTFGSDVAWDKVWYANPAGTGNTLIVNGQTILNGTRQAYDAARTCP